MTKFYTKKGDDGYTGLLGEGRAPKYDQQIEAIGSIDEANAAIALARAMCVGQETAPILLDVQRDLYQLMAEVAATPENAVQFRRINVERVAWIEDKIENISLKVTIPSEFIIPGDSKAGAAIDLARTVVRRAERQVARLLHTKKIENKELLHYLNRLSSLCFVLELYENKLAGIEHSTLAKA